jgi:surfactin synthase thioesterase subunit
MYRAAAMTTTQLFCFPYAGASASTYARWKRALSPSIEVTPVELAGHGWRFSEPLETTMAGAVAQIERQIRPSPGRPFALFGHSLGALVAFECALRLERQGLQQPCVLFASGCEAPSAPERRQLRDLSDEALITELRRLDGTPRSVLANSELMQLTLPILRADFQVAASYRGRTREAISTPIRVLDGVADSLEASAVHAWRSHTRSTWSLQHFEGGHFFIHECQREVLAAIENELAAGPDRPERWGRTTGSTANEARRVE